MTAPRDQWEWFGHAGHLIVGHYCRFHMATTVGDFLVSTVGEFWPERRVREIHAESHDPEWLAMNAHLKGDFFDAAYMERFGFMEIGPARLYETMVFRAGGRCAAEGCNCGMPLIDGAELDFERYNEAGRAARGHIALCEKWAAVGAVTEPHHRMEGL